MVLASECGRDYEHCFELQKKLDDLGTVSMAVPNPSVEAHCRMVALTCCQIRSEGLNGGNTV